MPPQPGTLIEGKYEILSKIREGGMGTIYKVRHRLLDEVRVVKVMRPHLGADQELRARFAQEAKTATRLKHPNIVSILDFALDADDTAYIVMEFIDGVNLLDLLRVSGPPSVPLSLEIGRQTLQALGYLHRKSMVHRDIAPDNLMLTHDEDRRPLVKLIDLGIAKDLDRTVDMTSTGVFLGKVKYSSPEQLGGLAKGEKIDGRSDLYSLGVVLYELLTGEKPIMGDTPRDLLAAHLFQPPRPFEETDPTGRVPEAARQMLLRALEKGRERRFQSPAEFAAEIDRIQRQLLASPDFDDTHRLLAKARDTSPVLGESITPSAQDRLDRHFGNASTPPPPTGPSSVSAIESEPTVAATPPQPKTAPPKGPPTTSPRPISSDPTVSVAAATVRTSSPRARAARPAFLLLALLAAGVAVLLWLRPDRSGAPQPGTTPAAPAPSPVASGTAESSQPEPVAVAVPEPSTESFPAPPADPTSPPAEAPSAANEEQLRLAEASRASTEAARRRAERAGAADRAPGPYQRARDRETQARRQLASGDSAPASRGFAEAERLYRQAETDARRSALAEAIPTAVPAPTLIARVEATRAPTPAPAVPSPAPPTVARPAAVPAPAPVLSDEDRIRETLATYRQAQNALDVALYARVYPDLVGASRQRVEDAFRNLRSQSLELDIQGIEVTGSKARVRVFETRTAVPRIGGEQRDQRARVIRLEKRGDAWVIAGFE